MEVAVPVVRALLGVVVRVDDEAGVPGRQEPNSDQEGCSQQKSVKDVRKKVAAWLRPHAPHGIDLVVIDPVPHVRGHGSAAPGGQEDGQKDRNQNPIQREAEAVQELVRKKRLGVVLVGEELEDEVSRNKARDHARRPKVEPGRRGGDKAQVVTQVPESPARAFPEGNEANYRPERLLGSLAGFFKEGRSHGKSAPPEGRGWGRLAFLEQRGPGKGRGKRREVFA